MQNPDPYSDLDSDPDPDPDMDLILIQILIRIWSWSRSQHGSDPNLDPDMDPILIQIPIWIWSWSQYGSATSSFVSPRPIFIEALAGEMPWREVRASPVKARQHLFWCSPLTASAVTLHFGLFSNLQASIYFPIYFCLNIFLMIFQLLRHSIISQYIFLYISV